MMKKYICFILLLFSISIQSSSAITEDEKKDYWIDKYLSVSFPLKSIRINSFFGTRADPFTGRAKHHGGLDLAARYEETLAMFDGYVKAIGYDKGSGKYIVMQCGDYTISYCHLSEIWVEKNMKIYAGDPVGVSGTTGRSTGPHLHITSRLRGQLQDPYDLLVYIRNTKQKAVKALHLDEKKIMTPSEFFKEYADIAMRQQRKYGIPSSVILAQMAFESGWGNSTLAQAGCNFFGIKANQKWLSQGLPYSVHDDDRPNEKFCNFRSPEESVEYHSRLLMSDRYARCWRYGSKDFHHWLLAIKASGYATRRDYAEKCERIIMKHKLYLYDEMAEKM